MAQNSRVAVLDNDELTLYTMRSYITKTMPDITIPWVSTTAAEAIELCTRRSSSPNLCIVDMSLSDMEGADVIRTIRRSNGFIKLLAITSFPLERYADAAARSGAQGIVLKKDIGTINDAIRTVLSNRVWAPDLSGMGDTRFHTAEESHERLLGHYSDSHGRLTDRERDIIEGYSRGNTSKQMAEKLHLTENTIKTYTTRIFRKLGATNRANAIAIWLGEKAYDNDGLGHDG